MSDISNIIPVDFTPKRQPIITENTLSYDEAFSKFDRKIELIKEQTITLAQIALLSRYSDRRRGANAQIQEFYADKVELRHRDLKDGLVAYLGINQSQQYVILGTFNTKDTYLESVPTADELTKWRAVYQKS